MKTVKKNKKQALLFLLLFLLLLIIWLYWGNASIQTTHIQITSEKIHTELNGFTIVQISDLHNKKFGSHQHRLLKSVEKASPNLIVITGDLIDSSHTDVGIAMEFISDAVKIAPTYYVSGNHEAWSNEYENLKQQMVLAGVIILSDEETTITYNGASFRLVGLEDPDFAANNYHYESKDVIDTKLKAMPNKNEDYTILLSHRPELLDVYAKHNIDLVFSGHAHGGQFRLPFIGGLVAPNQGFFPKYTKGVYEKIETKMIVSRGLGNSIIPLRINNRPELVIVTLNNYST